MSEDPDHEKLNAVFFSDVVRVANTIRAVADNQPPGPADLEAFARIAQKLLMDLGTIAGNLERIADAAERGLVVDVDGQFSALTNLAWEMGRSFKNGAGG